MRMFQNHDEPLIVFLCVQLLLAVECENALERRRLEKVEEMSSVLVAESTTAKSSRARGMQVAHSLVGEKLHQLAKESATARSSLLMMNEKPRLQVVPRSETQMYARLVGHSERPAPRLVVEKELDQGSAKTSDTAINRLKKGQSYRLANKESTHVPTYARPPKLERRSGSMFTNGKGGEKSHRSGIEHLPNALESLRRLGTDLNILGNELMGFHFPSYLRVLMYVISLIL